jgi:hypothetical protein
MHFKHAAGLIFVAVVATSCTPLFSLRLFNRSFGDIVVKGKDSYEVVLPKAKDKIVGSARDWHSTDTVSVKTAQISLTYAGVRGLWDLPRQAIRPMRFPAAGGSRECCLEFAEDHWVYVLNAKSLQRIEPQPVGFPIPPSEVIKEANPAAGAH